jgi:hypothetical protein
MRIQGSMEGYRIGDTAWLCERQGDHRLPWTLATLRTSRHIGVSPHPGRTMSQARDLQIPMVMMLMLSGCGAFRSQATTLGTDVIGAVREKEPELFEIERQLADSMGAFLGQAVDDKVLSRASGVWDTMLVKMNEQSRIMVGQLAQGVERDLNRSVQVMLSENLDLAHQRGGLIIDEVFSKAAGNIGPLMDSLRPELTQVVEEVTTLLLKRIRELDEQLSQSPSGKRLVDVVWLVVAGLAVTVIGGGLAWRRNEVRNREAFRAAKAALESSGPSQAQTVQQTLRDQGFHRQADWLQ